ncbi:ABC transporter permease subunit [Roseomonas xinghualingensis]|uniref:ABC transporter permease subunit n=1 Tax=Roseomonas xinghualingensis TaxID=2986475 RepID=UPI0021F0F885|nr:ABC transporter permease subunit [Roseomonas sp. SXEYE001]MCV4208294.1 ABC transporter permease subunit [Roseomonas sp. SXEYE001]
MSLNPLRLGALKGALLAMPLVLLVLAGVAAPIGLLLWRSVEETEVAPALPRTQRALRLWDGKGLPDDLAFETLATDLAALRAAGVPGAEAIERAARRLAADRPELAQALPGTAERSAETITSRATSTLVADPAWGEAENWAALQRAVAWPSSFHLLAAIGLRHRAEGGFEESPQGPQARAQLGRGFGGALLATLACLILAWPLARWIAGAAPRRAAILAAATLLPLLAGEAVRAAGWLPLLGMGSVAAFAVLALGLLPLMVLPVALALRQAGPRLPRAAATLGLSPWQVFRRIRLPQARGGIALGCALVFTQALGSFVAAELLAPKTPTAASALAAAARGGEWGTAGALAAFLLLPALLVAGLLLRFGRRGAA